MFSELDNIIFPDGCEVIKVASQHYVYPIFKCGRSSLTESMQAKGWTFVQEKEIANIDVPIVVFLRNPKERFLSGINTYLQHLDGEIDFDHWTALYFVNKYLFLNRHYAPQFFWLLHLARFSGVDIKLTFRDMTEISQLTEWHSDANVQGVTDQFKEKFESIDWSKLELYCYLDQILLDHMHQTVSIREILEHVKNNHKELYQLVFQKTLDITNVLSKT